MKTAVSAALLIALFCAGAASIAAEPVSVKGIAIQGNQLKATPGYVLEKGPNKQVLARPARGGLGFTANCGCSGGTGMCDMAAQDDVAVCSKAPSAPCSGQCTWKLGPSTMLSK